MCVDPKARYADKAKWQLEQRQRQLQLQAQPEGEVMHKERLFEGLRGTGTACATVEPHGK